MNYYPKTSPSEIANYPGQMKSSRFDHERLDVYKLELEFVKWVTPLIEEAAKSATGRPREVCDQLDRASISAVLNTAEGNGKRQRQVRAKFFDDARGSGTECAACLDVLVAKGIISEERIMPGKATLLRVVCMLSGLVDRFDSSVAQLREETVEYKINAAEHGESRKRRRTRTRRN